MDISDDFNKPKQYGKQCQRWDCIYHAGLSSLNGCDYMLIMMDKGGDPPYRRGCPRGEQCTRCQGGRKVDRREAQLGKAPAPPPIKYAIDEARARELWDAGKDDKRIAEAMGVEIKAVKNWRTRQGLKNNPDVNVMNERFPFDATYMMLMNGMSDREIGEYYGTNDKMISRWRRANGLLSATAMGTRSNRKANHELIEQLYNEGHTDKEISEIVGCTTDTVAGWRWHRRLPPNRREGKK